MGSKGKRYDEEQPKLNMKKVIAVIIAIIIIIMFIFYLKDLFSNKEPNARITSKSYFSIFQDGRWGVIDNEGNIVIDPAYEEMIVIPDAKTDIFLCTYDVNYEDGSYQTKALNAQNEEILTEYQSIQALSNKDNNHVWYESNVLKVGKDGNYGTIDSHGKELLPIAYQEITPLLGVENALVIQKDGVYGIARNDGKIVIEPQYTQISALGQNSIAGYIVQDSNGKYGIVGYSANTILPCQYDGILPVYGNDLYVVKKGEKQVLVDKQGVEVLTTGFDEITQILKSQENGVIFKQNEKYGVMKTSGEVTLKAEYDTLQEAKTGILIYQQGEKFGVIDVKGEQKIEPQYTNITYQETADIYIAEKANFEANIIDNTFTTKLSGMVLEFNTDHGYIKLLENGVTQYYSFQFEEKQEQDLFPNRTLFLKKQDGKYGFVNKQGEVVVDYQYDDATEQNDYGYAGIKKDGKWGAIDSTGKVIQEPIYDLEKYLLVNFIGRWHLGEDINMNYYVCT